MVFYDQEKYKVSGIFAYTLSTCVHCKNAKRLLKELGAEFDYVDVDQLSKSDRSEALAEMSRYNPAETFPTILIAGKVIVGDRDADIRQAVDKMRQTLK